MRICWRRWLILLSVGFLIPGTSAQNLKQTSGASATPRPALATEAASRYVGGDQFTPVSIDVDGNGNIYVMGFQLITKPVGGNKFETVLYKLSPQFEQLYSMSIGGDDGSYPRAMAIDASGNVYLTGDTSTPDFPLVNPIQSELQGDTPFTRNVFLTKLDPQGNIMFSTYFGGSNQDYASVLAVDDSGNAYIGGLTSSATDFPFTESARTAADPLSDWAMFIVKIATNQPKLVFATNMGGRQENGTHNADQFVSIAPVLGGDIYLLQNASMTEFPLTDNSGFNGFGQMLVRLSADGSEVTFATNLIKLDPRFSTFAINPDGNLILAGVLKFILWGTATNQQIAQVDKYGGLSPTIAVDYQGNVIVQGAVVITHPLSRDGYPSGPNFVAKFDGVGQQVLFATSMPGGAGDVDVAAGPNGEIYALGSSGLVSRFIPGDGDATLPKIMGIGNAAASEISPRVAPGEIVSLYGPNIGSAAAVTAQIGQDGRVTTSLAGVEVRFNGTPGSLLYTGPLQINAVAPFDLGSGNSVLVEVMHDGEVWSSATLHPVDADLGVFPYPGTQGAAALNQDGSINSSTNRADPGSIVTVFLTGAGQMTGAAYQDGEVFDPATPLADLPAPKLSAEVAYQGPGLEVLYYGQAPEALAGVIQLNFRLPSAPPEHENIPETIHVVVGGIGSDWNVYSADSFGIWVSGAAGN